MKMSHLFLPGFIAAISLLSACTKPNAVPDTPAPTNTGDGFAELTFVQKTAPVMLEYTSTGCPGCGSWGKPTFAELVAQYGTDITPLAVHIKYGDPMITPTSEAIAANRHGDYYTPQIWVADSNAVIITGGYIQQASKANAERMIALAKAQQQPAVAGTLLKEGDKLKVKYGADFSGLSADGDYYLACYLTEDGILAQQNSSKTNPAEHNHVIRAAASGSFGVAVTGISAGEQRFTHIHEFDVAAGWNKTKLYATVILWKKAGNRYEPVNGVVVR